VAAPVVLSTDPQDRSTGVPLGTSIVVRFDQDMDQASATPGSVVLIGPDNRFVSGSLSWDNPRTLRFTPSAPLEPQRSYRFVLAGGSSLTGKVLRSATGTPLASSYGISFTTGTLTQPPSGYSPPPVVLPEWQAPRLDPEEIQVRLDTEGVPPSVFRITLEFPAEINPDSIDLDQVRTELEAALADPEAIVPDGLETSVEISGNQLIVRISGWPEGSLDVLAKARSYVEENS